MKKKLNFENFKKVKAKFIKQTDVTQVLNVYSIKAQDNGEEFVLHCLSNEDNVASLYFNKRKKIYHCFSCGEKGNILDFIVTLENKNNNMKRTVTDILERYLTENIEVQLELGIKSLYSSTDELMKTIIFSEEEKKSIKVKNNKYTLNDWERILKTQKELKSEDVIMLAEEEPFIQEVILDLANLLFSQKAK